MKGSWKTSDKVAVLTKEDSDRVSERERGARERERESGQAHRTVRKIDNRGNDQIAEVK